jgi:hypothetical protein
MRIRELSLMFLVTTAPLAGGCLFECEEEEWNNDWECEDCETGEPNDTVCWDDWDCGAGDVCVSGFCTDDPTSGVDDDSGDDRPDDRVDVPDPGEETDLGDPGSDDHTWGDDDTTGGVCDTTGGDGGDSSDVPEDCDDPDESDSGDAAPTDSGGGTWLCEPGRACGGIQYCTDTCFGPDCCTVQCSCNDATGTLVCDLFCWE